MSNKNSDYYFLRGGGEMGALIRAKDWSKTSVGDPADWPQSLRTMVAVMLDNPFGMYIAWGSEYIQLYNDGYRPILGASKHPQALGISTRETFSEIWHIIESMFDGVMKGKAVGFPDLMLPLNRNGFVEECYFDFSYSPIRKNDGEVGGVLVTVIETTDKKKAQAALIENTTQLEFAMDAAELGNWDYNPATDKFTANNRLKTWFGLSASEEIELHHATDAIAEKDRDRIIMAIKKALDYSSGGIYEEEYSIINPLTNKEIIVQGKGRAWFNDERIAYRFNGILQEVTENVLARKKIEDSEEQLRIAIEGGEFGTFDFFLKTNQLIWSAKTKELFGLPPDARVDYDTYLAAIHPEDRDTSKAIAQQKADLKDGGLYELEYRTIGITDGKLRWLRSKGKATYNKEGEAIRFTGVIQDITKQKESAEKIRESNQRFRNTMKQAPVGITILRGPEYIVEMANDAYLQLVDKKEAEFVGNPLFASLPEVEASVHSLLDNVLNTGLPYHGKEVPIPVNRYGRQDECYFDFLYHPLKEEDGKISGIIVAVTEVTEKVQARKKVEDSAKRYNLMLMQSPFAFLILKGKDMVVQLANASMKEVLGKGNNIEGKPLLEVIPEIKGQPFPDLLDKVYNTGTPFSANEMLAKLTRNGILEDVYFNYVYQPYHEADGTIAGVTVIAYDVTSSFIANKKTEESEHRFRLALAGSNQIVFSQDKNLIHTWIYNPHPDFTQNDIIGKSDKDLHIPESAAVLTSIKQKVLDTGNAFNGDIEIEVGGKKANYTLHIEAIKDSDENITGIIGTSIDITERIKIEQRIKESEEQFSTLADNMENLAWLADGEGWIYWYNKRWIEYTGLTMEEMQGWGWQKVHHPDHVERVVELSKKIWNTNETFELTFPLRRHDGAYRWFLTRGYPVTNEEGKIIRWIGTNTDIDEQKKAEEQFRVLADQAPMWVWQTDKEINVLYANPEVLRFIGIAHYTEFTGHTWEQKVHPEDIALVYKSFGEAVSLQQSFSFEFRVQNAITQQYEWFYIKGVPRWEGGEFADFIGTGININEQKLILSQLEYRKALLESHNEASLDGILLVDTKGTILSYNHRFVEIWNMPQPIVDANDDDAALTFALTQLVNPEKFIEKVEWLYRNPDETSIDELEFKDGKVIKRYGYHVAGADGKYYGCSWIFRDITEQRESERTVKESEERFRSLAQTLPQLVWMTDAEGNQEFASLRWKDYSGIEPDGEKQWREIVHPEDYDNINAAWTRSLATGNTYTFNVRLKSKLGEYRWHVVKGEPVLDKENKIVKWVGSFTDIHEHKKAEEQFRQMAERMPQKVWTADALGNRNYFNQVMFDYTGLTFEELKDWGWKKIIHPEDWPHTKQKWEYAINTGEDFENETRLLRKDGKYLWHLVRATAVKDEKGNPKIWIGSKTEIQEQIELSETLGENLKRSNERMQTILQHAPDAVISIDEDGIIKSWNSEAELIFGWKEHEVIEKTLTETIIPKRYREGHDKGMKHFLRTGEGPVINKPIELSALKKNGSEFPVELKISTSKINDSYIFIGFIRDISIRKEAEETIQNKTTQLIEAQQLAHIGSWEWDVRTNKINWSDELYRIYGLTPQEFEADYEHFIKYVYPDDREYVNAIVQQAFKDHQPYRFFHKTASADGNVRILSATGKVFTDDVGNVIKMSGTAQDVTEQKKYEEELKISEERFFKIFDNNPVPMSLSEIKTNKIKYANNLFYNAFGYTKEEVIGNSSEELNLMDPEEYKRVIDLIFGYLHENRSLAEVQALSKEETETLLLRLKQSEKMKDFEICYTRKNGETFPAIVSFELIRIGTESYTVTSYQDITERKKSETLLKNQNDQLEKMNKELESFAYVSSHDLQEPLRKIQTFASRITEKEENNLSAYGKDMFNRMQNAAQRMQTLIQDLLAYSRTNTTERKFETTDLNEIIAEVIEDLKEELKEKHATIEANQLCDADIIPFQFRQLLHNLIGNSLKFSNPAQPPHIKIKCEIANGIKFNNEKLSSQKKYCHISVSDNGIGFEPQYSEKIFEVFQRLHSKNEYNGTGIGLSIVKKIVENHNGIITAKGELNKGATFEIYIPAT